MKSTEQHLHVLAWPWTLLVWLGHPRPGQHCSPYNRTGEWDSVFLGYSRDGFHWSRPVVDGKHRVFLDMNKDPAPPWKWNKANVQLVVGLHTGPEPKNSQG